MIINIYKIETYSIKIFSFVIGLTTGWMGYVFIKELINHFERRKNFRKNLERIRWRRKRET